MTYRRDIDGLRAVAVLLVLFFHAKLAGFAGGFVGVDVFFVISGYLITGLIVSDIAAGRFSFLQFYYRRIKRIVPALVVVYLASAVLATLLMLPSDIREFANTLSASALFVSNFLFYQQAGYFDAPSDLRPLLHTWSLSIEGSSTWYGRCCACWPPPTGRAGCRGSPGRWARSPWLRGSLRSTPRRAVRPSSSPPSGSGS
jgi:peptidoglycan/LPS O-acetylase OafA/YrhL